jgi:GNAT superfamily N-acetyltransferase
VTFRPFQPADTAACLALFDANCPASFAPNERDDYIIFLSNLPGPYDVCVIDDLVVGAAGLAPHGPGAVAIRWIVIAREHQGRGLGRAVMKHLIDQAAARGVARVDIATSQHSAEFFAKFGAVLLSVIEDGWGPGMHRIDMVLRLNGVS